MLTRLRRPLIASFLVLWFGGFVALAVAMLTIAAAAPPVVVCPPCAGDPDSSEEQHAALRATLATALEQDADAGWGG